MTLVANVYFNVIKYYPTMWYVVFETTKASGQPAHTRSLIRAFVSCLNKLLTEHHLEFLPLKGGCTDSSESTPVKMPHCWKSHVTAHIRFRYLSHRLHMYRQNRTRASVCTQSRQSLLFAFTKFVSKCIYMNK